jgi:hypothetical protein
MERGPAILIDKFPIPADKEITMQDLLNQEAILCNTGQGKSEERMGVHTLIRLKRDEQYRPPCFGEDDCSTLMLSTCPWRIDCGT